MSGPQHKKSRKGETKPLTARELRREALADARRVARRRIAFAVLMGTVVMAGAVVWSWFSLRDPAPEPNPVEVPAVGGVSSIVIVEGADGAAASVVLVASHPDHDDRFELLSPSLLIYVPGFGEFELSELLLLSDSDLVSLSVSNLLGIRVDAVHVLTKEAYLTALAEPLDVTLSEPFMVADGDDERVVVEEGVGLRNSEMLYRLMTEQGTGDESGFVVRQSRVWAAILEQIGRDGEFADGLLAGAPTDVMLAVNGAAQDPQLVVSSLPVQRAETLGRDVEQFVFDGSQTDTVVNRSFPYLQLTPEPRVVVEILNGNGGVGVTAPVAELLVAQGYHVIRTDNADRDDYGQTQVVSQGRENQQAAVDILDLLGFGEVLLELRAPSGIFGVTIILGQDISG